jgi:hypothetical protein
MPPSNVKIIPNLHLRVLRHNRNLRNRDGVPWNVSFICSFQISVFEEVGHKFSLFSYEGKETAISI